MLEVRRIRESAPIRKSMSMSEEDAERAEQLERVFTHMFPDECPFSFSKTISKALEIAYSSVNDISSSHLPDSQATLSLDNFETTRPPVKESSNLGIKSKTKSPKFFGKRPNH